jgi:hypothetical protein
MSLRLQICVHAPTCVNYLLWSSEGEETYCKDTTNDSTQVSDEVRE